VGALDQRLELPEPVGRLDIESHAALAEVPRLEILAVVGAPPVRPDLARGIARRRLDLDHLGAQLGQEHGAVGAGPELLQGEDADAGERLGAAGRQWLAGRSHYS